MDLSRLSYVAIDECFTFFSHDDPGISVVGMFLRYLADKGICSFGLCWYCHYYHETWLLCPKDLTSQQHVLIETCRTEHKQISLIEYQEFVVNYLKELRKMGYQSAVLLHSRRALRLLLVFLEMSRLGYHRAISDVWYEANEVDLGSAKHMIKKTLQMFGDYIKDSHLRITPVYHSGTPESAPVWGADALDTFILQKEKEKYARVSIRFYRSACIRLLKFLDQDGIHSYAEITQEHIRKFNITDQHKTTYSKNAYACRIRKFLRFLEREKLLSVQSLYQSLLPASSSGERIVITLTEKEKEKLHIYFCDARTPIQLRDRAILLLGKDMGIRACDIVKLIFASINWKSQFIYFSQGKTDIDHCLPMPTQVGNAIFAYLKDGRPKGAKTDFIFVQSKAPYAPLNKATCIGALRRALPDRKVPGSGFHVTRKTFSTDMLRGGAAPSSIADALGHSTIGTVHKYLGLDEQRMRFCPLSLMEAGISMKGDE